MKSIVLTIVIGIAALFTKFNQKQEENSMTSAVKTDFYSIPVESIDGGAINLADYKGKYILCVNVASKCGYTPQYKGLQELYEKYQDKLVVIGFPCNQFLGQEPGTSEEIVDFCEKNYGVSFPLSAKLDVKGKTQHPLYAWLTTKEMNGVEDDKVLWNFHKYLISPEGEWMKAFSSKVEPMSEEITSLLK